MSRCEANPQATKSIRHATKAFIICDFRPYLLPSLTFMSLRKNLTNLHIISKERSFPRPSRTIHRSRHHQRYRMRKQLRQSRIRHPRRNIRKRRTSSPPTHPSMHSNHRQTSQRVTKIRQRNQGTFRRGTKPQIFHAIIRLLRATGFRLRRILKLECE